VKQLTQTNLDPGNCWQTALAILLDLEAEVLPPQAEIEIAMKTEGGRYGGHFSYLNAIQCYLQKHHGLVYIELPVWQLDQLVINGTHLIVGPTVRTAAAIERRAPTFNHCVVGIGGTMVWDVHPSRAGLTKDEKYGLLTKPPDDWKKTPARVEGQLKSWREGRRDSISDLCPCPACFVDGEYL